jgi:uncharacterized membrane protein
MGQIHYLPVSPALFSVLAGLLLMLTILIQAGILRYAYLRLGMSSRVALLLLMGSLFGSYLNIPLVEMPDQQQIITAQEINLFGIHHSVPMMVDWPGTIIALNVGGALIPILVSFYLLARNRLWRPGLVATACVSAVCYHLAKPVAGMGIALPIFVPAIATAMMALILSRQHAATLAYIGGSLGTLIGADLFNIGDIQGLGAPVASIGGAGTFDGIFVTGILAVIIASVPLNRFLGPSPKEAR